MSITLLHTTSRSEFRATVRETAQRLARYGLNPFDHLHSRVMQDRCPARYAVAISGEAFTAMRSGPSLDATRWLVPVVSLINGRTYVMRLVHAVTQQFKGKVRIVSWAKP